MNKFTVSKNIYGMLVDTINRDCATPGGWLKALNVHKPMRPKLPTSWVLKPYHNCKNNFVRYKSYLSCHCPKGDNVL